MRRLPWVLAMCVLVSSTGSTVLAGGIGESSSSGIARIAAAKAAFPAAMSRNRRYLVDQRGRPFMIVGDSPQALVVKMPLSDAEWFLSNRHAAGFNSVWVNLLCNNATGGRADGATYDGVAPFESPGDLSTPSEAYFRRVDAIVALAAKHGITVFLDPIETIGWISVLLQNGAAKGFDYGRFLGRRYRKYPNIVWMHGNDFGGWHEPSTDAAVLAVARGIQVEDKRHIHTVELEPPVSGSLDDDRWRPVIRLDAAYTYAPTYAQVLKEYNRSKHLPTFMVEANYEFEHDYKSPQTLRQQEYWTMLSGATGQLYGNKYTWQFISGWKDHVNTTGVSELRLVTKLFASRPWYKLVPDQQHSLVRFGTVSENDYVAAARTPDGTLAMAYLPSLLRVTVNLRRFSASVRVQWYDPTTGAFSTVSGSPFANSRPHTFTPPGENRAGDGDWVLVMTAVGARGRS